MVLYNSISDLIGNTPMVKLNKLFPDFQVYAKLESFNLTGSMKARSALGMIEAAEKRGELREGMTLVESTSGNLGYALAAIGVSKGYEVILVVDPKTDEQKRNILEAYGAKLVDVKHADKFGAYQPVRIEKVKEIISQGDNYWWPNQYENIDNYLAHYNSTGSEIFEDLEGRVDVLVGAIGTCGHLCGSAAYIKEQNPNLIVIGVEPEGSVISGGKYNPYLVQGPGLSFVPKNYNSNLISDVIKVSDQDAINEAIKLSKTEGVLSGGSAGSVIFALKSILEEVGPEKNVVGILADDGFRYSGNFYDPNWRITRGILTED